MIEDLTIEKLIEYSFTKEQIEKLQYWDNYETALENGKEAFFASNIENKIYSGEDYYTKKNSHILFPYNDPDLVPKYFKQKQAAYLNNEKKLAGITYVEKSVKERFKQNEIKWVEAMIKKREPFSGMLGFAIKNKMLVYYLDWLNELEEPETFFTGIENSNIELKPTFKHESIQPLYEIIKDFFRVEQQSELKKLIESGNNVSEKLLFKGNGNRLTDTFKKLFEHDFITSCQKKDLIEWIISNFNFTNQNKIKVFVYDTVEKTISRNYYPCKSPLIEIKNGQIQKVEQPRTKKYNKY